MSRLLGGPFSRASGKVAGLVFSSARGKDKKNQTVREHVIPTNPRTEAQVTQRNKIDQSAQIVRGIGRGVYQFDMNRAVKQLAGFPSLMNIISLAMNGSDYSLDTPRSISLGVRHFPDEVAVETGTDQIDITLSTELGAVGADDDELVVIAVASAATEGSSSRAVVVDTSATRTDGGVTLDQAAFAGVSDGDFQVGIYFKNSGTGIPGRDRKSQFTWFENVAP